MNSRSKKYYETRKSDNGDKKGSSTKAGYNEENQKTIKEKENPAPPKTQDKPKLENDRSKQDS